MIRFSLIFFLIVASAPLARADGNDGQTLRSADGEYQLKVPRGWEAEDFHLDAVAIGAIDKHLGEYAEVVAENVDDYTSSLTLYAEAKRDVMAMSLDNPRMSPGRDVTVNGAHALRFEIHGELPNSSVSIGYVLTVLKTKTHYIQIIGWLKDSHFKEHAADLQALAEGFSESADSQK